ncbi:DUF5995 family protein [Geodermatophilus sp. DSM 44513]|uniref:DUF5995 family protein n=1 Tax=Geodermatophilus sp. DSM 44513 TaxID=1528104 RepID=UPI00128A99FD|nr:DUF5995 family protein [Geodermatophilus sp. DSM 44513]WNV77508.1 DUF5995 family protein [Geodermatophilus sp. DSM 44513]
MGRSVAALVARMEEGLAALEADGDPARFFHGVYLRTTVAVGAAIDAGAFEDPAWVEEWDVDFADLYLDALAAHRRDPASAPRPWQLALGARAELPPEAHVLLGMNAHINYDLPQSLVRVIPPAEFDDPAAWDLRRRDHERIDRVLASRVAAEDGELHRAGGRRTRLDRTLAPVNRAASRVFLRESRRRVWANAARLDLARRRGPEAYASRLADLEELSAARVDDLLRPGPVLVRLAVRGFGVLLPPD